MDEEKKAFLIAFDDRYQELVFPVETKDLRVGDLLLLQPGEIVPADCKLLTGEVWVQGLAWTPPQILKAGGLVESGTARAYVAPIPPHAYAP
jgi:Cu+-exporting ATPase